MTGTNATAPQATAASEASSDHELVTVRRREAPRRDPASASGPSRPVPAPRGRRTLAVGLDLALHTAAAAGAVAALPPTVAVPVRIAAGVAAFVLAWLLQRVVGEGAVHRTIGKAVAGLVVVRTADGRRPSLWLCLRSWSRDVYTVIGMVGSVLRDFN